MQIYSKSMKNATSPLFRNHNRFALEAGTYITHRVIYYPLVVVFLLALRISERESVTANHPETRACLESPQVSQNLGDISAA